MRKIIAALAVALSVASALPAIAHTVAAANTTDTGTYSAEAGAGGR